MATNSLCHVIERSFEEPEYSSFKTIFFIYL